VLRLQCSRLAWQTVGLESMELATAGLNKQQECATLATQQGNAFHPPSRPNVTRLACAAAAAAVACVCRQIFFACMCATLTLNLSRSAGKALIHSGSFGWFNQVSDGGGGGQQGRLHHHRKDWWVGLGGRPSRVCRVV